MRRGVLEHLVASGGPNAALWLARYLPARGDGAGALAEHIDQVAGIPAPDIYRDAFERWRQGLSTNPRCVLNQGSALGRLAIALGAESVLETSIALHHTYGVPIIPGSAIKGLCASYAHRCLEDARWRKGGDAHRTLFGNAGAAGHVVFHDAWWRPDSARALEPDVMTVHHPRYYTGSSPQPPADWDSPTPVPFLTARGTFLFALEGPVAWADKAAEILRHALRDEGIGAKTNAGYGRMELRPVTSADTARR